MKLNKEENIKSKIISIGTAVPEFKYKQTELAEWMYGRSNSKDEYLKRKFQVLYRKTKISERYSVLPDFNSKNKNKKLFGSNQSEPKVEERLSIYNQEVIPLATEAVKNCLKGIRSDSITHLITVSCTGMSAPGIEIQLKQSLDLLPTTECFAVNFVGCYASFPGLRLADYICKSNPKAKVLVVAVELCTIHFQNKQDDDNLLANSLFADGAASVLISSESIQERNTVEIVDFSQLLLPKGAEDMAWNIHSEGFLMKLTSYIPSLVDEGIKNLIEQLMNKSIGKDQEINHWAIHPGGRKILEVCEKELGLSKNELSASYNTLEKYGNMSAPTILFVLKDLLTNHNPQKGELVFACGFGPGLTLESAIFRIN